MASSMSPPKVCIMRLAIAILGLRLEFYGAQPQTIHLVRFQFLRGVTPLNIYKIIFTKELPQVSVEMNKATSPVMFHIPRNGAIKMTADIH